MIFYQKPISFIFIISIAFNSIAFSQKTVNVLRKDNFSYEVTCDITFLNNVSKELLDFCWNMENIKKMLADEPVVIEYSTKGYQQTISYDYSFIFMRYFSQYERKLKPSESKISFKLTKNECSIPFIPNLQNGYGEYIVKSNYKTTTVHYYQYIRCDGTLRDFYFNYIKKDIVKYFNTFENEFLKTLKNANR